MNREEEIKKAASEYTKNYGCFNCDLGDVGCGFIDGAKWTDEHHVNHWHSVTDGNLPLKAKNNNRVEFSVEVLVLLNKNRLAFGRYDYTYKSWYVGLQRVYPTHWAEIPELPTE